MSLFSLLTVLFVALKLTHYIDWPWLYVLSPLYIEVILVTVAIWLGKR